MADERRADERRADERPADERRCSCCWVPLPPWRPRGRCGFCADPHEPCQGHCGPVYQQVETAARR